LLACLLSSAGAYETPQGRLGFIAAPMDELPQITDRGTKARYFGLSAKKFQQ
jgi:hypothetical protein